MTESESTLPTPPVSQGFDKAKRLSRILSVVFAIGFWITLLFLISISLVAVWPDGFEHLKAFIRDRAPGHVDFPVTMRLSAIGILVTAIVPILGVFENARRVFHRFADGDVFSLGTIGLLRTTAIWLIIAGVVPPRPELLVMGIAAFVAAYVMVEARRLADEAAGIV